MKIPQKIKLIICQNRSEFDAYRYIHHISKDNPWVRFASSEKTFEGLNKSQCIAVYFGNYWESKVLGSEFLGGIEYVKE